MRTLEPPARATSEMVSSDSVTWLAAVSATPPARVRRERPMPEKVLPVTPPLMMLGALDEPTIKMPAVLLQKTEQSNVPLTAFSDKIKLDTLPIGRFVQRNSLL